MIYGRLLYSSYILGTGANQQRTIEQYILTRMTWTGGTILRQHRPTNVCPVLQIPRPKMFRTMYCRIIVANSKLFPRLSPARVPCCPEQIAIVRKVLRIQLAELDLEFAAHHYKFDRPNRSKHHLQIKGTHAGQKSETRRAGCRKMTIIAF